MDNFDALFTINQDCDLEHLINVCTENNYEKVLILTTHYFFQNEREIIKKALSNNAKIITFADLLSDDEMVECDDTATQKLLSSVLTEEQKINYTNLFMDLSLLLKNKKVIEKINSKYKINRIYCSDGLGIVYDEWKNYGAKPLISYDENNPSLISVDNAKDDEKNREKTIKATIVEHNNCSYVFFGSIKRLRINQEATIYNIEVKYNDFISANPDENSQSHILNRFLDTLSQNDHKIFVGTTIHEYDYLFLRYLNKPIKIFIDGYHPSNYSRSYLDSYFKGEFFIRDMFDIQWFQKHENKALKPPGFIIPGKKNLITEDKLKEIKNVFLMLNHAGDWSSLINRSDTDILIENFCRLATKFADINFIVRPHPTMAHQAHEGINSINRIKDYVEWLNLPNLNISNSKLEQEMEIGDLFISEYSQVLLDVFNIGKLGIIANFTGRRSYMEDYEKLGFLSVDSFEQFEQLITSIIKNPYQFCLIQNQAARKYNDLLEKFYM